MRWGTMLVALSLAATAVPARAAVPITAEQVAGAIASRGITVAPAQVKFLSQMTAKSGSPELEAVNAGPLSERRSKVQLRCRENIICLPFYVVVDWPDADSNRRALEAFGAPATQTAPVVPSPRRVQEPPVVHSGEKAMLVIEATRMRMEVPVICTQNGAMGAKIRVVSPDRKQAYMAEVVGEKLLRAGL